jgi:hypothetical protein
LTAGQLLLTDIQTYTTRVRTLYAGIMQRLREQSPC